MIEEAQIIEQGSQLWKMLMEAIHYSKLKSNTDSICVTCWKVLNYYDYKRHRGIEHTILSAKHFTSPKAFLKLSR
jgi:hypothetical protein